MIWKKGDILECQKCKTKILEFKIDIHAGIPLRLEDMNGIARPLVAGDLMECPVCKTKYGEQLMKGRER